MSALVLGLALLAGCSDGSAPPPGSATTRPASNTQTSNTQTSSRSAGSSAPATLKDCGKAADPGPDVGVVAGLYWLPGSRPLRMSTPAYICIGNFIGSTVRLDQAGGRLTIQPTQFSIPAGGGVLLVNITASTSGRTELTLRVFNSSGKQQVSRVVAAVAADQASWHFEQAG